MRSITIIIGISITIFILTIFLFSPFLYAIYTTAICGFIMYVYELVLTSNKKRAKAEKFKLKKEEDSFEEEIKYLNQMLVLRSEISVGILQLDSYGIIKYENEYYKNIFDSKIGEHYTTLENESLFDTISAVYSGRKILSRINVGDRTYSVEAVTREKKDKVKMIILQFYDVTKSENLDKLHQDFLVNTSHELNSPLSSLIMAGEILNEETPSELSKIILKESSRMKKIIEEIVEHSKLQQNEDYKMEIVNLSALCKGYLNIYEKTNIKFDVKVDDEYYCEGNEELLNKLFTNLLDNAFKYTECGSVNLSVTSSCGKINVKLSDTGQGIDQVHIEKVFERFYREDNSRDRKTGGLGIGLAIVKEICRIHDITIDVKSDLGIGTEFNLKINMQSKSE